MIMPGTFLFSLTFWQHSFGYIFLQTNRKYVYYTNGHHKNTKICLKLFCVGDTFCMSKKQFSHICSFRTEHQLCTCNRLQKTLW